MAYKKVRTIQGALPSARVRFDYQHALLSLIRKMNAQTLELLEADYKPLLAKDVDPIKEFEKRLDRTIKYWEKAFSDFGRSYADTFANTERADVFGKLEKELKKADITIKFRVSKRLKRELNRIIDENTRLIKSIPTKHFNKLKPIIDSGVRKGRDMGYIKTQVKERFGVTERRAIVIARDQTNKATEALNLACCLDIGITEGVWMHRSGSKVPRSEHIRLNGTRFDLKKGAYDRVEKKWILPAQLVNCHCTFRMVLPSSEKALKQAA